jgi:hypothetical protein
VFRLNGRRNAWGERGGLGAELAEVVIQMFVHSAAPLLRTERAKERMGMAGTLRFPALMKPPNLCQKLFLFAKKIPLIGAHQLFGRGAIPAKWLFVGIDGLDEWSQQPANEHSRHIEAASGHVHRRGTVRHHLRHVHLAPLPLGGGPQLVDPGDYLVD